MNIQARRLAAIGALAEPLRRDLYLFVAGAAEAVSRDQAAQNFGVSRGVAAFHLDKLAALGLVDVEYRRPPGRGGPGAGRPAKFYRRALGEVSFSVPARDYEVAGHLLAEAVTVSARRRIPVARASREVARKFGRSLGLRARQLAGVEPTTTEVMDAVLSALSDCGYEPRRDGASVALANCPFHSLAEEYRDLVCGMNLELMAGFTEELQGAELEARLEPVDGQCCVRLTTPGSP